MSKFITFNGVTLYHPGGLTKVDAAGMAQVAAGASGIVGIIGEADYGQPYDPANNSPKVYTFTDPDAAVDAFKSGPLADSIDFLFNPSNDIRIPGGAQQIVAIKSNIDTQSSIVAQNQASDAVSLTFTSVIYGKYSNALSAKVARNEADTDTLDVTVTDGNTATVETFTQICGDPLLDVQYAPSTPTLVGTTHTTTGAGSATTLALTTAAATPPITAEDEGRYVMIVSGAVPGGTVRRIADGGHAAGAITVEGTFMNSTGVATAPGTGAVFKIIREAIGPFFVTSYAAATSTMTVDARSANQPAGYSAGGPLFWLDAPSQGRYGDPENGPAYVHIVSGTGAGQIRRVVDGTGVVSGGTSSTVQVINGFATNPDNTSQFVFINAVPKNTAVSGTVDAPTATGGNAMGEGAFGVIAGASGISNSLALQVRPGWGEPASHGGASVNINSAGPARAADWTFTLASTLNVNAFVTALNNGNVISGATKGSDTSGSWKARVGLGRDGALPTSRFDFTGRANGAYTGAL